MQTERDVGKGGSRQRTTGGTEGGTAPGTVGGTAGGTTGDTAGGTTWGTAGGTTTMAVMVFAGKEREQAPSRGPGNRHCRRRSGEIDRAKSEFKRRCIEKSLEIQPMATSSIVRGGLVVCF